MLVGDQMGFRREAHRSVRRVSFAACIVDRRPLFLSDAVENLRPHEPAFTRSAREVAQGRGAETSLIQLVKIDMAKQPATEVQVFAGVDVSARELSVAVCSATEDREEVHTFSNGAAGHHALLSHLLCRNGRVRVCTQTMPDRLCMPIPQNRPARFQLRRDGIDGGHLRSDSSPDSRRTISSAR
jgi:hypothetical protein